jgi:ubiquitin-protein ligase
MSDYSIISSLLGNRSQQSTVKLQSTAKNETKTSSNNKKNKKQSKERQPSRFERDRERRTIQQISVSNPVSAQQQIPVTQTSTVTTSTSTTTIPTHQQLTGSVIRRILQEVNDCNKHFQALRTVVKPSEDRVNEYYFVMVPNDGALALMPLVGKMIVPSDYPQYPPALHLYTRTERYNVDVFHYRTSISDAVVPESSMCFDILNRYTNVWKPDFTISCLFASLMNAVVSVNVPQQYGEDKVEFVDMFKLDRVKQHVRSAYLKYKHLMPLIPMIKRSYGKIIPAKELTFSKPTLLASRSKLFSETILVTDAFYLSEPVTFAIDIRQLVNHPKVVVSFVLTTNKNDLTGQYKDTILFRNGVTGTAAQKLCNEQTKWFYHGNALNSGNDKIQVTVANNQFVICLINDEFQRPIVHGDTPISYLDAGNYMDNTGKHRHFYMVVYIKKPSSSREVNIPFLKTNGTGYIFDPHHNSDAINISRSVKYSDINIICKH